MSKDQNFDRHLKELKTFGCGKIYQEKQLGKDFARTVYQEMRSKMRKIIKKGEEIAAISKISALTSASKMSRAIR